MKLLAEELTQRRPVWEALSDLFLDTDISLSRQWRVDTLVASPYSLAELECILTEEVYPICKYNLLSVAGEWAGFDQAWLEKKILARMQSRLRLFHQLNLGRFTVARFSEWQATKLSVELARLGA